MQLVLKSGDCIRFDPQLHVFNVKRTSGVTRVITLHTQDLLLSTNGKLLPYLNSKHEFGDPGHDKAITRTILSSGRIQEAEKRKKWKEEALP